MIRRTASLLSLIGGVAFAPAARAQDTPQQLYKSGDAVKLAVLGVNVTLPEAPGGWALGVTRDGGVDYDVLERVDPASPALRVQLNRSNAQSCDAITADLGKLASLGLKKRDPSPLAPHNWATWSWERPPAGGRSTQTLCTNTQTGPVLATVVFEGAAGSLTAAWVTPLLLEVGTRINGHRERPAPGGGLTTAAPVSANGTMTLPVSNVKVAIPQGWTVKTTTGNDGKKFDLIERLEPKSPWLFIIVGRKPGSCQLTPNAGAQVVSSPAYLPSGWNAKAVELPPKEGLSSSLMCIDIGNEYVTALVSYQGSLAHPDVLATRAMLAPIAESRTPGSSYTSSGDVRSGGYGEERDSLFRGVLEVMGAQFSPAVDGVEKSYAGIVGLDLFATSNRGSTFGAGVELAGFVGYGTKNLLPWDLHLGFGPSVLVGPVTVLPMFGVGADGVSANDPHVKGAVSFLYGGRVVAELGKSFSLDGFVTAHTRSTELFDKELRLGGHVWFRSVAVGAKFIQYTADGAKARLLALSLGYTF